jgi:hypothetical protein
MEERSDLEVELFRVPLRSLPNCRECMHTIEGACYVIGEVLQLKCCGKHFRRICRFETKEEATAHATETSQQLYFSGIGALTLIEIEVPITA